MRPNRCLAAAGLLFFSSASVWGEAEAVSALEQLRRAAAQGDAYAQLNLGALYDRGGQQTRPNKTLARDWYFRAARQGLDIAQFNLGHLYATCQGPGQDYEKAVYWLRKASEQGMPDAQYLLGVLFAEGLGTAVDVSVAKDWLSKAARAGNPNAREYLATLRSE